MPFQSNPHDPCPYNLPALPVLTQTQLKNIDRRNVLRFLYVEGLLRSPVVWGLYQKALKQNSRRRSTPPVNSHALWTFLYARNTFKGRGPQDAHIRRLLWDQSLNDKFGVSDGWAVLLGSHHRHLEDNPVPFRIGEGIVDLAVAHRSGNPFRLDYLNDPPGRNLYFMVDLLDVSSSDITALKHLLTQRQRALSGQMYCSAAPGIKDLRAWLIHLQCYDLRRQGISIDEVGRIVLGGPTERTAQAARKRKIIHRKVTRSWQHVSDFIRLAEGGPWAISHL